MRTIFLRHYDQVCRSYAETQFLRMLKHYSLLHHWNMFALNPIVNCGRGAAQDKSHLPVTTKAFYDFFRCHTLHYVLNLR